MFKASTTSTALAIAISVSLGGDVALADSLTLRDGTVIEGVLRQVDGGYEITSSDGKLQFVESQRVKSIKVDNAGKVTEGNARERLSSLQRSIEVERDIERIIERYEQFIAMNADTEAARQAQADLAEWRGRRDQGMIKFGRRWMTPAQRDEALVAVARTVEEICALIAGEQPDTAATLVRRGLEDDPENISFQYLDGVLQLRRGKFTEAKRSFDAVAQQVDDHPPTIVNQAVVATHFKRWPLVIALLDGAMTLAPGNQQILDNVLEFMQLAPDSAKRSSAFERLAKRFTVQDAALAQRMAQRKLYRWGSRWVDEAQLQKVREEQAAYDKKKADMELDYRQTLDAIRKTEENIAMVERMLRQIESDMVVQDLEGRIIRRAYPPAYWDFQRDLDRLKQERATQQTHVDSLHKEVEVVKQNAPRPPFAGKLTPIGENGVPVILPAGAAQPSLPATKPAATLPAADEPEPAPAPQAQPPTQPAYRGLFD